MGIANTDEIYFRYRSTGTSDFYYSTTSPLTTGTWYFLELAWRAVDDYMQMWVDNTAITAYTGSITAFTGSIVLRFGESDGKAVDLHSDHFIITKDSTKELYGSRNRLKYDNTTE